MADLPPGLNRDTSGDTGVGPNHDSTNGTPRWVKAFGVIAVVLVLLVGVMLVAGGGPGDHGPRQHIGGDDRPADDRGRHKSPPGVPERSEGHTGPPPGVEHAPREP